MARRKTLNTLQAGRGLAALAVLLFHVNITLNLPKYLGQDIFPIFNGGYLGVAFFFVLSGFVIMLAHEGDVGKPERAGDFLWRRFIRLFPLLWIALTIAILGATLVTRQPPNPWDMISSFLTIPTEKEPYLAVEWTLRREVIFYLLIALLIYRKLPGIILIAAWFVLSAIVPFLHAPTLVNNIFDTYHLLFAMGMIVCAFYVRNRLRYPIPMIVLGTTLFFAMWWLLGFAYIPNSALSHILVGLGAMLMLAGLVGLECKRDLPVPSFLIFLGEASYAVYLIHYLAISMLCKLATHVAGHVPAPVLFAGVAVGALATGIAFHLAVEKPLLRMLRKPSAPVRSEPLA